jgi:diguanylate cyclase
MDSTLPVPGASDTRTDVQTGLPSRWALQEDMRRRLAEAQRHGNRLSLLLIKIGGLAELMARERDPKEKIVLKACTQFFTAAAREMDFVARYDKDVFAIELPGCALVNAVGVARRLKGHIESCPLQLLDEKLSFRLNIGTAEAQPGEDVASLIGRAEDAMAASIAAIRNEVQMHNGISIEPATAKTESGATGGPIVKLAARATEALIR